MLKSIDVVLATYNGEPYLSEQLLTIQGSGDVHLDSLIVSDDGSNDGTLDVVNKFESLSSLRVQVVQKKYNQVSGAKQNFCRGLSKLQLSMSCFLIKMMSGLTARCLNHLIRLSR